jgi:hypothetical protein
MNPRFTALLIAALWLAVAATAIVVTKDITRDTTHANEEVLDYDGP